MSASEQDLMNVDKKRSSSSVVDSASVSDTAPVTKVEMLEVTPTQRAIKLLLRVPSLSADQLPMEAMSTLKQLEERKLPKSLTSEQLKPKRNPRSSCFDTGNEPASWCSHQLCQRREAFNQVLQASREDASSGLASAIAGISLCITDCVSDSQGSGGPAKLPVELLYLIVDHAIEDMRNTKVGNTVAALLHVSSTIRLRIVKAFTPIKLYEVAVAPSLESPQVYLSEEIVSFICPTIRWFLQDVSVLRHDTLSQPSCISTDSIIFSTGVRVRNAGVSVTISPQKPNPAMPQIVSARHYTADDETFDVSRAGKLLVSTFNHCKPELQDPKVGDCPPRIVNVHQRALSGLLSDRTEGITIEVTLKLKASMEDPESKWCVRNFKYVTRAAAV